MNNTNLISVPYKYSSPIHLHPSSFILLRSQITSLYIVCLLGKIYNYCLMNMSFKSHREEEDIHTQSTTVLAYILTCVVIFISSLFLLLCKASILAPKAPFNISYREGLLVMNSLSFCLSKNVLISPLSSKTSFVVFRILGWQILFSLQDFKCALWLP